MPRPRTDECKYGHPRTEENTRVNKNGDRYCRVCDRDLHRRIRAMAKIGERVNDYMAELEAQLAELRDQYAANPRDWALSAATARAEQRWRSAASAESRRQAAEAETQFRARDHAREMARIQAGPMPFADRVAKVAVPITWRRREDVGSGIIKDFEVDLLVCPNCHGRGRSDSGPTHVAMELTATPVAERGISCGICSWSVNDVEAL